MLRKLVRAIWRWFRYYRHDEHIRHRKEWF